MALKSDREIFRENYEALLLNYAAGVLDQAQSLIVAVHMALSPKARGIVRECEAIGGALMERECKPVAMREASLKNVLGRLDQPQHDERRPARVQLPPEVNIPVHILEHISCRPCRPKWRAFYPGLRMCELPLECKKSGVRFIKGQPAAKMPHHTHQGIEITLVLDGAYADDSGMYHRGDMIVLDETLEHSTTACRQNGVVAMVVSNEPVRFHGLAALLNPFIRF